MGGNQELVLPLLLKFCLRLFQRVGLGGRDVRGGVIVLRLGLGFGLGLFVFGLRLYLFGFGHPKRRQELQVHRAQRAKFNSFNRCKLSGSCPAPGRQMSNQTCTLTLAVHAFE